MHWLMGKNIFFNFKLSNVDLYSLLNAQLIKNIGGINSPVYLMWTDNRHISFMQTFYDFHVPGKKIVMIALLWELFLNVGVYGH